MPLSYIIKLSPSLLRRNFPSRQTNPLTLFISFIKPLDRTSETFLPSQQTKLRPLFISFIEPLLLHLSQQTNPIVPSFIEPNRPSLWNSPSSFENYMERKDLLFESKRGCYDVGDSPVEETKEKEKIKDEAFCR